MMKRRKKYFEDLPETELDDQEITQSQIINAEKVQMKKKLQ